MAHTQINWFGTVTGRLGHAIDRTLLYVKGGGAWIRDECNISDVSFDPQAALTGWGWTVGAGFEYALSDNLSALIEYDYLNFGTA